jgi:ATP-dependent RNA helicase RhlE
MSFDRFNLDPKCLSILHAQGITSPTPVQAAAIPLGLEGRDLIAVAQTGTGKTMAFALPALTRLAKEAPARNRMLVLAPTRELACQVHKGIEPLAKALGMRSTCIYGGVGMEPQTQTLRRGVDIVVATPGRLLDHIRSGNVRFDQLRILVLDEADRMLDMGFIPDIRRILSGLPADRQTLLFSATFPEEISKLAQDFQRDVKRIEIGRIATPADAVKQRMYTVDGNGKTALLAKLLSEPQVHSAIVFIRTKHRTDRIAKQLSAQGIPAQPIHGGRSQGQRDRALDGFRQGRFRVLVATDVAARGIDIQGISHVINYDIPRTYDDYVHRIGRTGRASAKGHAVTFVSPEDIKELRDIETGLGSHLPRIEWEGEVKVMSLFGSKPAPKPAPGRHDHGGRPRNHHRSQGNAQPRPAREAQPQGQREQRADRGAAAPVDRDQRPRNPQAPARAQQSAPRDQRAPQGERPQQQGGQRGPARGPQGGRSGGPRPDSRRSY